MGGRGPKRAVPTRTRVAPSAIASSKSALMPIDRLEVNIAGEESKGGCAPADLPWLAEEAQKAAHIRLRGLMAIPPAGPCWSGGGR